MWSLFCPGERVCAREEGAGLKLGFLCLLLMWNIFLVPAISLIFRAAYPRWNSYILELFGSSVDLIFSNIVSQIFFLLPRSMSSLLHTHHMSFILISHVYDVFSLLYSRGSVSFLHPHLCLFHFASWICMKTTNDLSTHSGNSLFSNGSLI